LKRTAKPLIAGLQGIFPIRPSSLCWNGWRTRKSRHSPRPGRIHKEYRLPFAELGVGADLREIKNHEEFGPRREEILSMIWDMEEEIMGRTESAA